MEIGKNKKNRMHFMMNHYNNFKYKYKIKGIPLILSSVNVKDKNNSYNANKILLENLSDLKIDGIRWKRLLSDNTRQFTNTLMLESTNKIDDIKENEYEMFKNMKIDGDHAGYILSIKSMNNKFKMVKEESTNKMNNEAVTTIFIQELNKNNDSVNYKSSEVLNINTINSLLDIKDDDDDVLMQCEKKHNETINDVINHYKSRSKSKLKKQSIKLILNMEKSNDKNNKKFEQIILNHISNVNKLIELTNLDENSCITSYKNHNGNMSNTMSELHSIKKKQQKNVNNNNINFPHHQDNNNGGGRIN